MESKINFKIRNVGPVANANIKIGKINVVGGKNSTGKSTSSKILYCFLRANSSNRQDLAIESLFSEIRRFNILLGRYLPDENLESLRMSRREVNPKNFNELTRYYEEMKISFYEEYAIDSKFLDEQSRTMLNEEQTNFQDYEEDRIKSRFNMSEGERRLNDYKSISRQIKTIDKLIPIIESNSNELYESTMETLIRSEFVNRPVNRRMMRNRIRGFSSISSEDLNFEYSVDFARHRFGYNGIFSIEDVYYLDSYSLFDLGSFMPMGRSRNTAEHITRLYYSIRNDDESENVFDKIINEDIIKIEDLINDLIGGNFGFERNQARFSLNDEDNMSLPMSNTASGVKQIGILQLLLANRKLQPGSFLIIDEPEVNLHPEWQVKFAGILVLLAKDLDITLYINTHSPLFIQAIDAYSEYYDLNDDTNYYLTEKSEVEGRYDINKVENDELYIIYDNLGKPYDFIDIIKIKNSYKDEEE